MKSSFNKNVCSVTDAAYSSKYNIEKKCIGGLSCAVWVVVG